MPKDRMTIVAACDENFVQHLGVMLSSLLHANPGEAFRAFILTTASEPALDGVREVAAAHDCELRRIPFDVGRFTNLPTVRHLSHATYFRLAIADALPENVARVLYIDCDVIVKGPIRDLWETDLRGSTVGAVPDQPGVYDLGKLKLPPGSKYFNAGILLIDVDAWRRDRISENALAVLQHEFERTTWADQCALNIVLHDRWRELPCKWNLLTPRLGRMSGSELSLFPDAQSLLESAAIIHYSTHSKPWHYASEHPAKHLYWEEIRRTPWRRARPTGRAGYIARRLLGQSSPVIALYSRLRERRKTG